MKNNLLSPIMILVGLLGVTGCALDSGGPSDAGDPIGSAAGENVATAQQSLLGSAHAQAFGVGFTTPDFGNGFGWFGLATATGDLDGDGAAELVVGLPMAHYGALKNSDGDPAAVGAVDIFWGKNVLGASFGGLSAGNVTQLHEPGVGLQASASFGESLAIGDFNCDGHPDLAVGTPRASLPLPGGESITEAGSVSILYGPNFASTQWQLFWQGSAGIPGVPEVSDHFGAVLAVGNFNHDSSNGHACDDLAIGTPDESIESARAGAVTILYGRSTGLNTAGAPAPQLWDQNVGSVFGVAEAYDKFGASLAAGDFNHDGIDDLAIGVPDEGYEAVGATGVGLVQILKGSPSGITDAGNYVLQLNDFSGLPLQTARMGFSLARGDFDHDGDDDLAVGVPYLAVAGNSRAGGAIVYRQTGGVLGAALLYDQNTTNVPGTAEGDDLCGFSLAAGDFDGDGKDDLASGCPGEVVTANGFAEGAINVARFGLSAGSLYVAQGQLWDRDSAGIPGQCTYADYLGFGLVSGDFNGDGKADVVASTMPTEAATESLNVFYGAP